MTEEADQPLPWPEEEVADNEAPGESVLTVTEVNRMARLALEEISVTVQGEVCGLATGYAYYVYFDLRDEESSLPAILTQRQFKSLDFKLAEGASVVVSGSLSLYERQGKYQVRVAEVRPFGEGELRRRIEALKKKLHSEGLFDDAKKKPLPRFPDAVGVVTSPRGAAIRDVIVTLGRRFPPARVFIRGVRVQGAGAAEEIRSALEFFDESWPVDVVILARGGGSLQDLDPFNSEVVARAIAGMNTPVVTGIGHEPDVTVADLVADRRASTPTGAAEASVPERAEVHQYLSKSAAAFARRVSVEVNAGERRVTACLRRPLFRRSDSVLGSFMQRWERVAAALPESPRRGLQKGIHRLSIIASHPVFRRRKVLIGDRISESLSARQGLERAAMIMLGKKTGDLERTADHLRALSPLAVLERGYSITRKKEDGRILRSSEEVDIGTRLEIRLGRGELEADVTGKE